MINDPMERLIAEALDHAGVTYITEGSSPPYLDFYLPDFDVYIEVKQYHTERIAGQMSRAPNVIVAQGKVAVATLAALLKQLGALKTEAADRNAHTEAEEA